MDRGIAYPLLYFLFLRRTIMSSVRLLLRVLYPFVGTPQGTLDAGLQSCGPRHHHADGRQDS
ncbi:MAG: hypothetical protein CM1200mP36_02660 [Gammaproteobacteria bacterium]|nr:MAG: hypothetical protein CM1200mP36_02660 [Gammaproteobacteria bacterium]